MTRPHDILDNPQGSHDVPSVANLLNESGSFTTNMDLSNSSEFDDADNKYAVPDKDDVEHPFCTLSLQLLELNHPSLLDAIPCSRFCSGIKFQGHQKSKGNSHKVEITIRLVDFANSTLWGFLQIANLTEVHPVLTTFFEGEIISDRYNFLTKKWGANAEVDKKHWSKFPMFEPYSETFTDRNFDYKQLDYGNAIFMRWKEQFTIPELKPDDVSGASFAGFYYICYDREKQTIDGYYYHRQSEWYQSLTLKVSDEEQPFRLFALT
ncbi:hypothetical protein GJ496_010457 [Pomphorhynchus laevis]|nr:hypothetical protein GJ496_010457 [Pomphorhynchus laevis]